jgi:ribosomal protein L11 methyltransferase
VEAAANARINGVAPRLRAIASDGIGAAVRAAAPFDLIAANILARPLKRLAGDVAGCLAGGGWLVLAGFLTENARDVRSAYTPRGLTPAFHLDAAGWAALVLKR